MYNLNVECIMTLILMYEAWKSMINNVFDVWLIQVQRSGLKQWALIFFLGYGRLMENILGILPIELNEIAKVHTHFKVPIPQNKSTSNSI